MASGPPVGLEKVFGSEKVALQEDLSRVKTKLRREVLGELRARPLLPERSIKPGLFGNDGAQGPSPMLLGYHHLEIGRGAVFGFTLTGPPFHKEAVAQAPEHPHDPHPVGIADAASIIVVRDIQTLMGAVFDPPAKSVVQEPLLRGQFLRLCAGHQGNQFVFATLDLA